MKTPAIMFSRNAILTMKITIKIMKLAILPTGRQAAELHT
jgi:hypothetical protein